MIGCQLFALLIPSHLEAFSVVSMITLIDVLLSLPTNPDLVKALHSDWPLNPRQLISIGFQWARHPFIIHFSSSSYLVSFLLWDIGLGVRVFANGPGDLGSIPGRVIPKTQKMVLDASLLNTQHYKVRIKGKVEQSRKGVAPSPTHWCSSYRKGSLRVTLDYGRQLYFFLPFVGLCDVFLPRCRQLPHEHSLRRIRDKNHVWPKLCSNNMIREFHLIIQINK